MSAYGSVARIIEFAMKDVGFLQQGELPTTDQYTEYSDRLLDLINAWQTDGLKLWLQEDLSITMVAGQLLYTLSPTGTMVMVKPLRVIQAYLLNTSGAKRPLMAISREEYHRLSNTSQQGSVNSYYVDKQRTSLNIYLWQSPDATAVLETLHLIIQRQVTNFTAVTDLIEFPPEWYMALRWGLADDISTGQPDAIVAKARSNAMMYKAKLEDWDVEDADVMFTVDMRR